MEVTHSETQGAQGASDVGANLHILNTQRKLDLPSAFRVQHPRELLAATPDIGHATEIVHAATLFSEGATHEGAVDPDVLQYFADCKTAGLDTLYVVGVWKPGGFSRLVMPHFAGEWSAKPNENHIGPSVFSIAECVPNKNIGSFEALDLVTEVAREQFGLTLVFDFVPNTTALASDLVRKNPDLVCDWERPDKDFEHVIAYHEHCEEMEARLYRATYHESTGTPNEVEHQLDVYSIDPSEQLMVYSRFEGDEEFTVYLQRGMQSGFYPYAWIEITRGDEEQVFCKQLGSDGYTYWADVLMLDTNSPDVQAEQAQFLKAVGEITPIVRADMSHLPRRDYWGRLAEKVEASGGKMPEVWGEAYGVGVHDELAQENVHTYANFIREWLTRDGINVPALMHQLYHEPHAREFYKRGMSVGYTANHDDDLGTFLLQEGAASAILCAMPISKVMLAQGQRHGDTHRYGADQHVPMEDYKLNIAEARRRDPGYAAHMDRLMPLMSRDVFRSPESDWKAASIGFRNRDPSRVFHIVRTLGEDRVLTIVDCQSSAVDSWVDIDVAKTFGVAAEELQDYALVDLLFGSILPAEPTVSVAMAQEGGGYTSHMYALFKRDRLQSHQSTSS